MDPDSEADSSTSAAATGGLAAEFEAVARMKQRRHRKMRAERRGLDCTAAQCAHCDRQFEPVRRIWCPKCGSTLCPDCCSSPVLQLERTQPTGICRHCAKGKGKGGVPHQNEADAFKMTSSHAVWDLDGGRGEGWVRLAWPTPWKGISEFRGWVGVNPSPPPPAPSVVVGHFGRRVGLLRRRRKKLLAPLCLWVSGWDAWVGGWSGGCPTALPPLPWRWNSG